MRRVLRPRGRSAAGFTLLEVLIAFAIAALALGTLMSTLIGGLRSNRAATQYETALALARSHLAIAASGAGPPQADGVDGAFAWRTRVSRLAAASAGGNLVDRVRNAGARQPLLLAVQATVSWDAPGASRQVRLETRRLAFAPPPDAAP